MFKTQQDFEQAFADVGEIFIDVTEIPVERPSKDEKQKQLYTGKKKPAPANGSS